ncbi:MAG: ATP-binding cassette domain-containing protein [Magnetococcales bacterium]|nr:ATP-binding cassette domain-containing protein [Magnetococcales bacterium]
MVRLMRRFMARPGLLIMALVASLIIHLLSLASSIYVIQVLNRYVSNGVDSTLITLTVGVLLAIVMEWILRRLRFRMMDGFTARPDAEIAGRGFFQLTGARGSALIHLSEGQRREAMMAVATLQGVLGRENLIALMDFPFALLFVLALFILNARIGVVASIMLGLVLVASLLLQWAVKQPMRQQNRLIVEHNQLLQSVLKAVEDIRIFNAHGMLRQVWGERQTRLNHARHRVALRQETLRQILATGSALMSVAVIAQGALLVVNGDMTSGAMIGANILAGRALAIISRFSQLGAAMEQGESAAANLEKLMKLPLEMPEGTALQTFTGNLELNDVAFVYPGSAVPLFESLSVRFIPGSLVVVAGDNGAGKTTLARLLTGFLDPVRGKILADGLEYRQMAAGWLRRQLVYFPQEPVFFDGTLLDNIIVNRPDIPLERLNMMVDSAGLRRFVNESPDGLQTRLEGGGGQLALGVRRRIALARGLVSDGMIAIFDDPLEGLDGQGVSAVMSILAALKNNGRTVIVLSHDVTPYQELADACLDLNMKPKPLLRRTLPGTKGA